MIRRASATVLWVLWALILTLALSGAALTVASGARRSEVGLMFASVGMLGYATVGVLVASRYPRNPIGWLLQASAFGFVLAGAADAYAVKTLIDSPGSLPGGDVAAWVNNWATVVALAPIPLIILLFPTGRPPSTRWRPVAWAMAVGPAIGGVGLMIVPGPAGGTAQAANLTGVESLAGLAAVLMTVGAVGSLLAAFACVAGLVVRFRRSRGEERQQIRWLAYVGAAGAVLLLGGFITDQGPLSDAFFNAFVFVLAFGLPAAVGIAILRHRLYDIDVVINKTLVYGALAGFITAVYVGVVVGIGSLIGRGDEPNLALSIAATAIVAVAFQPLRARVQHLANRLVYGKRATPFEALSDLAARMGEAYSSEDLLPRMARILAEGTGARPARVWLLVEDELRPAASWPPEQGARPNALQISDGRLPAVPGAAGTAAVRHHDELLGLLSVDKPQLEPLTPTEERLLQDLASQAGLVLRNVRLTEELRARLEDIGRSRSRIVATQDEERRRIERDLDRGALHRLVPLVDRLQEARWVMSRGDAGEATAVLVLVGEETTRALEELRDLARGIYPPLLTDQGLVAALTSQARKSTFPVEVEADGIGRYRQEAEAAVYFCVLEALQNVAKHAEASRTVVRLEEAQGELRFTVADDGVGFDSATISGGSGIQNMADRLAALGGEVEVRSLVGAGTTVTGRIPVQGREPVG